MVDHVRNAVAFLGFGLVLALSACATPGADPEASRGAQISVVETERLGEILVDGEGNVLYIFVPDNRQAVTCASACALSWRALIAPPDQLPVPDDGIDARLLGSMADAAGRDVVTYGGWPLYRHVADERPGEHLGHGTYSNDGMWHVMRSDGTPITTVR